MCPACSGCPEHSLLGLYFPLHHSSNALQIHLMVSFTQTINVPAASMVLIYINPPRLRSSSSLLLLLYSCLAGPAASPPFPLPRARGSCSCSSLAGNT